MFSGLGHHGGRFRVGCFHAGCGGVVQASSVARGPEREGRFEARDWSRPGPGSKVATPCTRTCSLTCTFTAPWLCGSQMMTSCSAPWSRPAPARAGPSSHSSSTSIRCSGPPSVPAVRCAAGSASSTDPVRIKYWSARSTLWQRRLIGSPFVNAVSQEGSSQQEPDQIQHSRRSSRLKNKNAKMLSSHFVPTFQVSELDGSNGPGGSDDSDDSDLEIIEPPKVRPW